MDIEAYHGTHKNSADSICAMGTFIPYGSEKDWLGKGVYFYDSNQSAAYNFCASVKRLQRNEIRVLKVNIQSNMVFNLCKEEQYSLFKDAMHCFRERVKALPNAKCFPKILDGHVIDAICKDIPFDFVYAAFPEFKKYKGVETRIEAPHTINDTFLNVLSVKNTDCIDMNTLEVINYENGC